MLQLAIWLIGMVLGLTAGKIAHFFAKEAGHGPFGLEPEWCFYFASSFVWLAIAIIVLWLK